MIQHLHSSAIILIHMMLASTPQHVRGGKLHRFSAQRWLNFLSRVFLVEFLIGCGHDLDLLVPGHVLHLPGLPLLDHWSGSILYYQVVRCCGNDGKDDKEGEVRGQGGQGEAAGLPVNPSARRQSWAGRSVWVGTDILWWLGCEVPGPCGRVGWTVPRLWGGDKAVCGGIYWDMIVNVSMIIITLIIIVVIVGRGVIIVEEVYPGPVYACRGAG